MMAEHDLPERAEDIFATDWASRFESFSQRDLRFLRGFNDVCWELANRSFVRTPVRMYFAERTQLEHAGTEALEIAAVTVRKTLPSKGRSDKELASHARTLQVLRDRATGPHREQTVEELDDLAERYGAVLARTRMSLVDAEDLQAGRWPQVVEKIAAETILDNWLNGRVVHTDPIKAEAIARWSRVQYEWVVAETVHQLARVLLLTTHVVVRCALGILDEDRRTPGGPGITATSSVPSAD